MMRVGSVLCAAFLIAGGAAVANAQILDVASTSSTPAVKASSVGGKSITITNTGGSSSYGVDATVTAGSGTYTYSYGVNAVAKDAYSAYGITATGQGNGTTSSYAYGASLSASRGGYRTTGAAIAVSGPASYLYGVDSSISGSGGAVYGVMSRVNGSFTSSIFGFNAVVTNTLTSGQGPVYGGHFYATGGTTNYGIFAQASGNTSYAAWFTGNVVVIGTISQSSDLLIKRDIADMRHGALSQVLSLKPKTYRFNTDDPAFASFHLSDDEQIGLIAQDVAKVVPQAVTMVVVPHPDVEKQESVTKQPDTLLTVDYSKLVPVLIKAIQEQQAQIDALRALVKP